TAGDVNGDGYSDVIVGAYRYDNGQADEGRAFVYHGSSTGLAPTAAWTAESDQAGAYFGWSVSTAGDVNGDGYSDVIVGAYNYDNGEANEGHAFVYHGSSTGLASSAAWAAESDQADAYFGYSVSTAGDVNGDGYSDVIVGAYSYDNGQIDEGRAFVYHGSATGLAATAAWTAESDQEYAYSGHSVSTAGDVNGDGYSDVIVGAYGYDNGQTEEGRAFVYLGSATGLATTAAWFTESDQAYAYFGISVSTAGDVNGDGYSDVIVGAMFYDNGETDEGRAYVYHGSATGLAPTAAWTAESDQSDAWFGHSVSTAGDVNGDGYSDVIVGAHYYDDGETDEGRAFVYHGSATGLGATAAWNAESDQSDAFFGYSVSTAGDVNGDGYSDVIIGAYYYDNVEANEGRAFVYHGSAAGLASDAAWTAESNQASAYFGRSVSTAGDVNGDGYSDVIVGADYYDNVEANEGRAFVYHGSATGLASAAAWTAESNQASAYFGSSVSTVGDVNGDGYSDVIVGAYNYDNGETDEGRAFVYHGSATGLATSAAWTAESDQTYAYFGVSVSTAGDVNGDGYSDVIVGAPFYDNGQASEGRAFVYLGNGGTGLRASTQQYEPGTIQHISAGGNSGVDGEVRLSQFARSPFGRAKGKLVYEVKENGVPFSSSGTSITNSVMASGQQAAFTDLGTGVALNEDISGLLTNKNYKWRCRIEYNLASNPYQKYGPWRYFNNYNAKHSGGFIAINTYTLTYAAGTNGSITGATPQTVNHGGIGTAVTAVPATGYHFVNWSDGLTTASRTDSNVTADISVSANFAINTYTYTLSYTAGANGSITGTTSQTVNHGASGTTVTAVPATGYHFVNWSDGVTTASRIDSNVTADISVTANFATGTNDPYTLTYTAGANGSITGTTPQTVNRGDSGTAVTAVPATGYHFVQWSDGSTTNPRTDSNVTADISVTANFAGTNTYTLTYTAGANGSITGTTPQTVNHGASGTAVTAVPATNYHFVNWSDGLTTAFRTDSNVTVNIFVTANFAINTYTLIYAAGANGSITGTTPQTVNHGASGTAVTAVPATNYRFVNWNDGLTTASRTDSNVIADVSVTAIFSKKFPWPMFLPAITGGGDR
ncbi:MAG: FG-GAP-like repeat-containing protein, partial [Desulfocapsaceae bacterium]|nr:FG-GAP-like repeat-containing protein [Desulfocapsaceae bacterium]